MEACFRKLKADFGFRTADFFANAPLLSRMYCQYCESPVPSLSFPHFCQALYDFHIKSCSEFAFVALMPGSKNPIAFAKRSSQPATVASLPQFYYLNQYNENTEEAIEDYQKIFKELGVKISRQNVQVDPISHRNSNLSVLFYDLKEEEFEKKEVFDHLKSIKMLTVVEPSNLSEKGFELVARFDAIIAKYKSKFSEKKETKKSESQQAWTQLFKGKPSKDTKSTPAVALKESVIEDFKKIKEQNLNNNLNQFFAKFFKVEANPKTNDVSEEIEGEIKDFEGRLDSILNGYKWNAVI